MTRISVTEAESAILAVIWRHGPLSAASLIDSVKERHPWGDATIKTLLHRLIQKQGVRSEKIDGRQLYSALIERKAYLHSELQSLADRLFGGDRAALLAEAFAE